ncbi:hypothetical protein NKH77_10280 [Streptomyces sp. M19]
MTNLCGTPAAARPERGAAAWWRTRGPRASARPRSWTSCADAPAPAAAPC